MKEIQLTHGKVAIVDDDDFSELSKFKWRTQKGYKTLYAVRWGRDNGSQHMVFMHRVILNAPDGMEVDHKDGNGLNNMRENIRVASHAQNQANMSKHVDNKSGYKGVAWHRQNGKWRAEIRVKDQRIHLGLFDDPSDAACAYDDAAREMLGEFARLNFPERL